MKIFTFYPTPIFYIPTFGTFFYLRARLYDPHSYKLLRISEELEGNTSSLSGTFQTP